MASTDLRVLFDQEHNPDGTHGDVVADTITLQGASMGVFTDLPYDAARFETDLGAGSIWTVDATDVDHLRFTRLGELCFVQFHILDSQITIGTASSLLIKLPELQAHPLRDSSGFSFQIGGSLEWEDADGTGVGVVAATCDPTTLTTRLILHKFHQVLAAGTDPRNFQLGGVEVTGCAMFRVTPDNRPLPT